MITTILIILAVYVLSCLGAYRYIQKAHYNEKGRWYGTYPSTIDEVVTFFPFTNTLVSVMYLFGNWREKEDKTVDFFKPKNK